MRKSIALLVLLPGGFLIAQSAGTHAANKQATVHSAPSGGTVFAQMNSGATVEVIGRERDWVRVRIEGWVKEADLSSTDTTYRTLSVADIRSDPASARGKLVRWEVETVALRTADPLRTSMQSGEQYLLALGPGAERSLVYIAVPDELLASVRGLPALARATVTARVREGRSQPAGVPLLDLESIVRR